MAISAVPAGSAQDVCDALQKAGISGILNLAPKRLEVDSAVVSVISVDLAFRPADSLETDAEAVFPQ